MDTTPVGRHTIDRLEQRHYLWAQSHGHHTCGTSHHRQPGAETLPVGTKPWTPHLWDITPSTAWSRHYLQAQSHGHHAIDRLQETLPADTKPGTCGTSHHRLPGAETLPAGTKPWTSHLRRHYLWAQSHGHHTGGTSHRRPPGGERCRKRNKRRNLIFVQSVMTVIIFRIIRAR